MYAELTPGQNLPKKSLQKSPDKTYNEAFNKSLREKLFPDGETVKPHRLCPLQAAPDCRTVTVLRSKDTRFRQLQMPEESSSFKLQSSITVQDETEAEECQGIL